MDAGRETDTFGNLRLCRVDNALYVVEYAGKAYRYDMDRYTTALALALDIADRFSIGKNT